MSDTLSPRPNDAQQAIDRRNSEFWDALCGTQLAQTLGITDFSLASLERFDAYYLGYYPYLLRHVPLDTLWGKRILEIGLGYGTLAQKLAAVASEYVGLDIAAGPVALVNERLRMIGLPGRAVQGSILAPPLEPASFDAVVTIGCLHHTGDLALAIRRIEQLLRPGGRFHFMIYNAYSYRRLLMYTRPTLKQIAAEYLHIGRSPQTSDDERSAYDAGEGGGAPETVFTSARAVRGLLANFTDIRIVKENAQPEGRFAHWTRERMLERISPRWGLDLYVSATLVGGR